MDRSVAVREAFYNALIDDMCERGKSIEDITAELERISGNPVRVDGDAHITFTIVLSLHN
jgi:hypothetical protein